MTLFKSYIDHLWGVVASHKEVQIGLGSSATGAVSYEVGRVADINTFWDNMAHILLVLSIMGALFALFRGWYSFRKEWRADRLAELKKAQAILEIESEIKAEI